MQRGWACYLHNCTGDDRISDGGAKVSIVLTGWSSLAVAGVIETSNPNLATEAEYMETHIVTCTEVLSAKEEKGLVENTQRKNKKEEDGAFDLPIASGTWFDLLSGNILPIFKNPRSTALAQKRQPRSDPVTVKEESTYLWNQTQHGPLKGA
ncbi:hypothetical protein E5288_WYG013736 [Bos mutus]|uniref:Uncharacterized protein n=1 Tax=Bos mutus TaxID=72004 RepID=A0A6B0QSU2_9CETA|nr:hypothetical protein [Bos mutus]